MLEPEAVYHIYNRANGNENLSREEKNYLFFLEKFFKHIHPIAEIYAWCLMPNHFHFMLRIRKAEELRSALSSKLKITKASDLTGFQNLSGFISQQFSNLFNAYSKAINKAHCRHGSLFQRPFKHKEVTSDAYFTQLVLYIHNNPVKHGFVRNLHEWPYSSFPYYLLERTSLSDGTGFQNLSGLTDRSRSEVLDWFGGLTHFKLAHKSIGDIRSLFD